MFPRYGSKWWMDHQFIVFGTWGRYWKMMVNHDSCIAINLPNLKMSQDTPICRLTPSQIYWSKNQLRLDEPRFSRQRLFIPETRVVHSSSTKKSGSEAAMRARLLGEDGHSYEALELKMAGKSVPWSKWFQVPCCHGEILICLKPMMNPEKPVLFWEGGALHFDGVNSLAIGYLDKYPKDWG